MERVFGSSIDVLHEALKIAHTYTFFDEKFLWIRDSFRIMAFRFSHVLYAYYAERKFCHKYTRALSPVWNRPLYTLIICEKNSAHIYEKSGAAEMMCERLIERWDFGIRLYHVLYMWSSFGEGCFCWLVDVKFWL